MERLTTDECRALAEGKMTELAALTGHEALERFGVDDHQRGFQEEVGAAEGRPYQVCTFAIRMGDVVVLSVGVDPLPEINPRRGLLGLVDAWRYGGHVSGSMQTRELPLR